MNESEQIIQSLKFTKPDYEFAKIINDRVNKCIKNNILLDFEVLYRHGNNLYIHDMTMASDIIINFITAYGMTDNHVIQLFRSKFITTDIIKKILQITEYEWPNLLEYYSEYSYSKGVDETTMLLLEYNKTQINDDIVNNLIHWHDEKITKDTIMYLLEIKYTISDKIIHEIIKSLNCYELYSTTPDIYSKTSYEHLILACQYNNSDVIECCLQSKITPTNECIDIYMNKHIQSHMKEVRVR